jgi:hypothetical protein
MLRIDGEGEVANFGFASRPHLTRLASLATLSPHEAGGVGFLIRPNDHAQRPPVSHVCLIRESTR